MDTMETKIVRLLMVTPGGITFQDLAKIKGFSGDTELHLGSNPGVPGVSDLVIWGKCSGMAIQSIENLTVKGVISVVPLFDLPSVLVFYNNGSVPSLPVIFEASNRVEKCWLPCTVQQGINFHAYLNKMDYFGMV